MKLLWIFIGLLRPGEPPTLETSKKFLIIYFLIKQDMIYLMLVELN